MASRECFYCNGSGIFLEPDNEEEYDKAFDRYDRIGVFSHGECREKALNDSGFSRVKCENCNGTGSVSD